MRDPERRSPFIPVGIWFKLQRHFLTTDEAAQASLSGVTLWLYLTAYAQRASGLDSISEAACRRVCEAIGLPIDLLDELVSADYLVRNNGYYIRDVPHRRFWVKVDCGLLWSGGLARDAGEGLLICAAIDRCASLDHRHGHLRSSEVEQLCRETGQSVEVVRRLVEAGTWRQRKSGITV